MPQMIISAWVPEALAEDAERAAVAKYAGPQLTNKAPIACVRLRPEPTRSCLAVRAADKFPGLDLEQTKRAHIIKTLVKYGMNKAQAAIALKIGRQTLYNKLTEYKITIEELNEEQDRQHQALQAVKQ